MGGLEGDGKNPYSEGELIATKRKIILKKDGSEKELMSQKFPFLLSIRSISWLPDGKHLIIVAGTKIGTFDTETLKYSFLTNGLNPSIEGPKQMPDYKQGEIKKWRE